MKRANCDAVNEDKSMNQEENSKNPEKSSKKVLTNEPQCGILSKLSESSTRSQPEGKRETKNLKKVEKPLDKGMTKWYNK